MEVNKKIMNDLKKIIDDFFVAVREELTPNAYQHIKKIHMDLFQSTNQPFVCTTQPKRKYVVDNKLIDTGFKIYYQFTTEEDYQKFKNLIFNYFKEHLFIKIKKYPNSKNELKEGYIKLANKNKK